MIWTTFALGWFGSFSVPQVAVHSAKKSLIHGLLIEFIRFPTWTKCAMLCCYIYLSTTEGINVDENVPRNQYNVIGQCLEVKRGEQIEESLEPLIIRNF